MIRAATPADLPALVDLDVLLFGSAAWPAAALTDELTGPGRVTLVSVDDGDSIVGYAVTMVSGDIADLNRIGVALGRQRSGVARELLEAALASAKARGADRMLLEVSTDNRAALAFYAAAGFTEIDRRVRYYKDGSDAIVMRRSLAAGCGWSPAPEETA